jgi:PDZ domain
VGADAHPRRSMAKIDALEEKVPARVCCNCFAALDGGPFSLASAKKTRHWPSGEKGIMSVGTLKQFNITFDYPHHTRYFDKNAHFGKPDVFNRSGLAVQIKPEGPVVASVLENSPAQETGILGGDTIAAIDGWMGDQITAERLVDIFWRRPGTVVRLSICHLGATRDVHIKLRDIL